MSGMSIAQAQQAYGAYQQYSELDKQYDITNKAVQGGDGWGGTGWGMGDGQWGMGLAGVGTACGAGARRRVVRAPSGVFESGLTVRG